jgi:phospholipase C
MNFKKIAWLFIITISAVSYKCIGQQQPLNGSMKSFKKIVMIVLENTNTTEALKQPFMSELTKMGAYLENMNGETHPSQGNYIAMIAGDTLNVNNDSNVDLNQTHLGDLLEKQGLTWKAYAEGYPGNCFLGASKGKYARKHVPFLSFTNVSRNPARCANIVNDTQFEKDIANNALPNFSLFVPNLDSDGHDTGVNYADLFMAKRFGKLLKDPNFLKETLVIVTFDESATYFGNSIYTSLIGAGIVPGSRDAKKMDHISLLRMIEDEWGLGNLGRKDQTALPPEKIWK